LRFNTSYKQYVLLFLTLSLVLKTIKRIMAMLVAVEIFYMAQILLLLVRRSWIYFLILTLSRSFLSSLPHLPYEG
jgi:hypothetical protein